jgi:uncharacterized protein
MTPRVVIDTNVVISAILFGGTPGALIPLWKNASIQPTLSKDIFGEYLRVLAYPKFELSENEIAYLLYQELLPYFEVIDVTSEKTYVPRDPSDDKFIYCAFKARAEMIISGDTHLLSLKKIGNIRIFTPAQFLKIF